MRLRLRDDVRVHVHHRDATPYGSAISGLCDKIIQRTCRSVLALQRSHGARAIARDAAVLLAQSFAASALGQLYVRPGVLRETCLYPQPDAVRPVALHLSGPSIASRIIRLPQTLVPELAQWFGQWSALHGPPHHPLARGVWDELCAAGALTPTPSPSMRLGEGVTLVGHATVMAVAGGVRLVFDPFLLPPSPSGGDVRPLCAGELAPDAVFITHSHPDHYDLGSLLRWGAHTQIFVPHVERESLLAVDMRTRLQQLGFQRVTTLGWGETVALGIQRVTAHPFHGEQPTPGEVLHPEVRNAGNVYVVETGSHRAVLLADAGRDRLGDCSQVATHIRTRHGPVDSVFGGYRAWRLVPIQYIASSVARYLLFVPRDQWGERMQIMNDADDLREAAVAMEAKCVVPYANGGAPWYWEIGLGPRPDRGERFNDTDFDPDARSLRAAFACAGRPGPRLASLHAGQHAKWSQP